MNQKYFSQYGKDCKVAKGNSYCFRFWLVGTRVNNGENVIIGEIDG